MTPSWWAPAQAGSPRSNSKSPAAISRCTTSRSRLETGKPSRPIHASNFIRAPGAARSISPAPFGFCGASISGTAAGCAPPRPWRGHRTSVRPKVSAAQGAIFAYAVLSRMAYVLFVGSTLRRQDRNGVHPERVARAEAFRRFRRTSAVVMNHDALAFVVLCLATRNTWHLALPAVATVGVGAVLVIIGLGTKLWAARTLGSDAYYWHNFFDPDAAIGPVSSGPYRFISSPMYTIGY